MIHISIDGLQYPVSQGFLVRIEPYSLETLQLVSSPATIGVAPVALTATNSGIDQYAYFRNVSTGGQIIGLGGAALVNLANAECILYPGETSPVMDFHQWNWNAVASAAGASLAFWYKETDPT